MAHDNFDTDIGKKMQFVTNLLIFAHHNSILFFIES